MNSCLEEDQENIVKKYTQRLVFQLRGKSKSNLLNYSYFTIFAPDFGCGNENISRVKQPELRGKYLNPAY